MLAGAVLWRGDVQIAILICMLGWIAFHLHRIEVKLNRLLDERGIFVSDRED